LKEGYIVISENLRKEMIEAYTEGDYDKALKLSQELDIQIVNEMRGDKI
jgi:hypothetical protein